MNLSENLNNSFEYAKKMFSDFGRLIILMVIDLIPLVNLTVVGYAARVLRETPGNDTPPILEKYGDMFVDGVKICIASLIYMLIPLALIGMGMAAFITLMVARGGPGFMMGGFPMGRMFFLGGTGMLLVLAGVILAFLMLIILGVGIAHMIKTGKFGKAFAFGEILSIIGKIGWVKYLGWAVLVAVIGFIVGAISAAIPFIGWLAGAVIAPVLTVFFSRSLGLLYSEGSP